ncbi:hypothetical protein PT974_05614 [Cladobotryum mycophilum]|uniref:Uncharacterized protein n=1 Tax=Cladobotryum mycophilum TaxID=491253 RepID=A0ABR0SJ85_9HYPO
MADDRSLGGDSTPRAIQVTAPESLVDDGKKESKSKKRSIFGFGKKKTETSSKAGPGAEIPSLSKESSKLSSTTRSTTSPTRLNQYDHPFIIPASPTRGFTTSPGTSIARPTSSAIPNHIQTENYIPSVLDDASEAITNRKLDPDTVEIVTHTSHQPASVTVTGASAVSTPYDQTSSEWAQELASFADRIGLPADSASNYGSLDSADVRRLSFISFADVVQSEHTGHHLASVGSRDNLYIAGLTSLSPSAMNRSPSPIRSPVSSQGPGTSPPTSNPGSIRGIDLSPPRKPLGSPTGTHYNLSPTDLNIETMAQALRRTGSTDFSKYRSTPQSPIDGPGSR